MKSNTDLPPDDDAHRPEEDSDLARRVFENWRKAQNEARAKADAAAAAHLREHRRLSGKPEEK